MITLTMIETDEQQQAQDTEYTFNGPIPGRKDPRTRTKGIMRRRRETKRKEAEARNAQTPIERTRRFRLNPPRVEVEGTSGDNEGVS